MRFIVNVRLDGEPALISIVMIAQDYTAAVRDIETQLAAGFVQLYDVDAEIHYLVPNIARIVRYAVVDEEVYKKALAVADRTRPPPAPNSGNMTRT